MCSMMATAPLRLLFVDDLLWLGNQARCELHNTEKCKIVDMQKRVVIC